MKIRLMVALVAVSALSHAQVLWSDNFDSYTPGGLAGQGGWITGTGISTVVAGGGSLPVAHSPNQMVSHQPSSASIILHNPTGWSTRAVGNDVLVLTGSIYVSSGTTNLGSAGIQVVGAGSLVARMGFVGLISNQFVYGVGDDVFFGTSAVMDQWNNVRLEVNTITKQSKMFGNGVFQGELAYNPGLTVINNWSFQTIALGGAVSKPVYFDSFQAEAVPEPLTLVALGFGGLIAVRRRRG